MIAEFHFYQFSMSIGKVTSWFEQNKGRLCALYLEEVYRADCLAQARWSCRIYAYQ